MHNPSSPLILCHLPILGRLLSIADILSLVKVKVIQSRFKGIQNVVVEHIFFDRGYGLLRGRGIGHVEYWLAIFLSNGLLVCQDLFNFAKEEGWWL